MSRRTLKAVVFAVVLLAGSPAMAEERSTDDPPPQEEATPDDSSSGGDAPSTGRDDASEESVEVSLQEGDNGEYPEGVIIDGERVPVNSGGSGGSADDGGLDCMTEPFTDDDLVTAVYGPDDLGEYGGRGGLDYGVKTEQRRRTNATDQEQRVVEEGDERAYSTSRLYSPTGEWVTLRCTRGEAIDFVFNDLVPVGGPSVTLGELLNEALLELDPAVHEFTLNPDGKQLVQFPTLFWVDPAYWETERTTSKTNGNVFLSLTLVPFESEWDPGDGSDPVVCDGPGEVWEKDDKGETFYCKHTYRTVEGQPFTVTSTVRFRLDTETNSNEVLGPFPPIERIGTAETGVREIQVVETS